MRQAYAPVKVTRMQNDEGHKNRELPGVKRSRSMDFRASKSRIFPALMKKAWQSLHNFKHVNITDLLKTIETMRHHTARTSFNN